MIESVNGVIPVQSGSNSSIISGEGSSAPLRSRPDDKKSFNIENLGISGGLCNVVYYDRTLSKNDIHWIYKSLNDKSPPLF